MHTIYWLTNETRTKTYVGFTKNVDERLLNHKRGEVKSTKNFGAFQYSILEKVGSLAEARKRERYWKSAAGRRKLKEKFEGNNFSQFLAPSSNG